MANVDLKSLFTSEKQYTVLQLLNVLIDEVGKSMVKTATINQDVSAGTLTITVTLSDDSIVTASTKLNSLTDAEKSLISTLQSQVTAISDGITFTKFVGFEGNETHKGNEIHQGYESHLGDESHSGTASYKGVIKTEEIDNTSGNAMLRNKSTEGAIVLGSSTKKAVIMGSGDRPTYSKDGSDFSGSELALRSDVSSISDIYIFAQGADGSSLLNGVNLSGKKVHISDLSGKWTNGDNLCSGFACSTINFNGGKGMTTALNIFLKLNASGTIALDCSSLTSLPGAFEYMESNPSITLTNTAKVTNYTATFYSAQLLTTIPAFDMSGFLKSLSWEPFYGCYGVTSFLAYGCKESFNISSMTLLDRAALRTVIDNLATVSTSETLTLGSANLAKLTADDITVAKNKGWSLA